MVDKVINGLIGSILGAVAFVAVRAMTNGSFYGLGSNWTYEQVTNPTACSANASNCTYHDPTAGELMIHDILPLAIAIMVVAGIFLGLTHVRGV